MVLKNGKKRTLNTKWDNYFEPKKKNHFQGAVYIFTNGGSFSCSAIVANTFKEQKRGAILGKMTGGSAFINAGGPNKSITLPNTKILFTIPKTQYNLRANTTAIGVGVLPDILVEGHPSRLLDGEDNFIHKFMELVNQNQ